MPKYEMLVEEFSRDIETGVLKPGDRLPSFAEQYAQFKASTNTVERAFVIMEKKGLIRREHGRGVFVCDRTLRPRTGVLGIVGLGLAEGRHLPYWGHLFQGVRREVNRAGGRVLWLDHPGPDDFEGVDGVLVSDDPSAELTKVLPADMPFVWLMESGGPCTSVTSDDAQGMRLATEYLLARGHRKIAYLLHSPSVTTYLRLCGYRDALAKAGIVPDESWERDFVLQETPSELSSVSSFEDSGETAVANWIEEGWSALGCTALLCHNDHVAIGALRAFRAAGIAVPDDVSVVGFDGTEICNYTSPRLTSVQIPLERIGERAVGLLLGRIEMRSMETESILLPLQIKVGESVGAPANNKTGGIR
jgi:DNA-binding LacI/PurR family transcriptional regulator